MRINLIACALGFAASLAMPHRSFSQPCSLDLSFNPALNSNAQVYAVTLLPNGQILIGGLFQSVNQVPRANVARLNPDGTLDATFDPGTAADVGYVSAIAAQADGKLVIGGSFGSSSGETPGNLARLNPDGTVDVTFDPNLYVDAAVNAVVMQANGMILFGGSFGVVDGLLRRNIARLNPDGSLDSSFDACVASSAGSGATALAVLDDGKILVSGSFYFSTGYSRNGIARLGSCGELDSAYAPSPGIEDGATAYTFALQTNGQAVLGGDFRSFHRTQRAGVAQLTPSGGVDFTFNPGTGIGAGTTVYGIAVQSDGKIIIAGDFTAYNEQTIFSVARINPDGSLDTPCDPGIGADNSVSSLAVQTDGRILVAGKFTTFSNVPRNGLARLNAPSQTTNQAVIAGTVYYPSIYPPSTPPAEPVATLPLSLTGDANQSTQTASNGSYSFTVNAGGNFSVGASLTNSYPAASGITTVDIALIRRHILNLASLDSPYKLLAADVNGSGTVTTLDISLIRRVVLGFTNSFPAGLWRLAPSDYVFPDPENPWDAPVSRGYTNLLADQTGQDFVAIELGDVNHSWTAPVGPLMLAAKKTIPAPLAQLSGPEVMFQVSSHTNQPGETVAVEIAVNGFRQVSSAQFTLAWLPTVLRYAGTGGYGIGGLSAANFGARMTQAGQLSFSWDDPEALGVTAADGSTLFTVTFQVVGKPGDVSALELVDAATVREVGVKFAPALLRAHGGKVTVDGTPLSSVPLPKLAPSFSSKDVFSVALRTISGRRYILEFTDLLPSTDWTALPAITGDGAVKTITDPAPSGRCRFYRLRIE